MKSEYNTAAIIKNNDELIWEIGCMLERLPRDICLA